MVLAHIVRPWYDIEGRKYIDISVDDKVIKAKVPYRYNRVMCKVIGIRTIQELKENEIVEIFLEKKLWGDNVYWVIVSLSTGPLV
jgi:uncharacterized protein YunC (DUF1805 family)